MHWNEGYRPLRDMLHEPGNDSWTKFYVCNTGKTNGAHLSLVKKLKDIGQTEVKSSEKCDYVLVICPIVSRVGTNISEALESLSDNKPVILVVMHHTFIENLVVAESRRQVEDPRVRLTVDCLFHDKHLLHCDRNEIAWFDIKTFLQGPDFQVSRWNWWNTITRWRDSDSNSIWIVLGIVIGSALVVSVITLVVIKHFRENP